MISKNFLFLFLFGTIFLIAYFFLAQEKVQDTTCAQIGEMIGASGMPGSCCEGLQPMSGWQGGYTGECSILPPPGGLSTCSHCGNAVCDISTGENLCNCPQDCS